MLLNIKRIKLKLQLSHYLVTTMNWYEKEGFIEHNKFIEDSIRNHINYVAIGSGANTVTPTIPIEIQISIFPALKLYWKALITKTSVSNVVNEILAFSLPYLIEQCQEQEDFRFEVELKK